MIQDQDAVRALYQSDPNREWHRLERHRTEFAVTLRALEVHLPPPPAHILDCGSGPGRYAIELARKGYQVTLFDLSSKELDIAREAAAEAGQEMAGYEVGTALDLSRFADASFDAVLCLGPLYHLLDEADRRRALEEVYRVARPDAPVFVAFIARYAAHRDTAANYPERLVEDPDLYQTILDTGCIHPRSDGTPTFVAYLAHPAEVQPLCREAGFDVRHVLGVEGVVSTTEEKINTLQDQAWNRWVDVNYEIAHDPYSLGGVEHILAVCRKPKWRGVLERIARTLNDAGVDYAVVGGAALALHGLPVPVNDLDVEIRSPEDLPIVRDKFSPYVIDPIVYRESEDVRSFFGKLSVEDVPVEIIAALEWRREDRWVPSFLSTYEDIELSGTPVSVLTLEEEALATLRRGKLKRAALALPHCDPVRFQSLLCNAQREGAL
jgi:ubiquinone/menaquinone biosynthesis C-methylase UbiE